MGVGIPATPQKSAKARCSCGRPVVADGECAACGGKRAALQRSGAGGTSVGAVPPVVPEVLRSPGRPLDPETQHDMESRFGSDFSHVRLHTDAKAAESARAVNALAYTVGRDIVFDSGRYAPQRRAGRALLAHELTHVLQQRSGPYPDPLSVARPGGALEHEAHQNARAVGLGARPLPHRAHAPESPHVARLEPSPGFVARPPVAPPRPGPGVTGPLVATGPTQRYVPDPRDLSLWELWERARRARDPDSARAELELPTATIEPGGSAPDFVTVGPTRYVDVQAAETFRVYFHPHEFHLPDAIQYDVSRATSADHLRGIYRAYFPDSLLNLPGSPSGDTENLAEKSTRIRRLPYPGLISDLRGIDPGGVNRMRAFVAAGRVNPSVSAELNKILGAPDELASPTPPKEGPCLERLVPRGTSEHDRYALQVSGSQHEYHVKSPEGLWCRSDGRDARNPRLLWEVKTGHDWASEAGLSSGLLHIPYFHRDRVMRLEKQRADCLAVAARCGYSYAYAFDDEAVAKAVKRLWGNLPPVFFVHFGPSPPTKP